MIKAFCDYTGEMDEHQSDQEDCRQCRKLHTALKMQQFYYDKVKQDFFKQDFFKSVPVIHG